MDWYEGLKMKRWVVVVDCPDCGEFVPFNERSTARVCPNRDCRSRVTFGQVRRQIEEELERRKEAREPAS